MDVDEFFGEFGGEGEGVDFELALVEELAVAVGVLDEAEGLLIVHLVLLDLLDLVLLVLMQHVPAEVRLVVLQDLRALSVVEVGRHKLVEVLHVHELGVDLLQHLLVESLLQDVLVLLPQPHGRGVHRPEGYTVRQLDEPSVFSVGLEDLQVIAFKEDDVRQVKLQSPCSTQTQSVQDLLQPEGRFTTVSLEEVAVCGLSTEVRTLTAEFTLAVETSSKMGVAVDGAFEVADDKGVDFGCRRAEVDAGLLTEAILHEIKSAGYWITGGGHATTGWTNSHPLACATAPSRPSSSRCRDCCELPRE